MAGADLDETARPERNSSEHVRKTQDSLRVLAEETGGIAVVNQNNFDKALKRIDAETSDYYVLGYYSTQSRSAEADAQDRSEGEPRRRERVVADVVLAAPAGARRPSSSGCGVATRAAGGGYARPSRRAAAAWAPVRDDSIDS